jgi:hypothetical protein
MAAPMINAERGKTAHVPDVFLQERQERWVNRENRRGSASVFLRGKTLFFQQALFSALTFFFFLQPDALFDRCGKNRLLADHASRTSRYAVRFQPKAIFVVGSKMGAGETHGVDGGSVVADAFV